MKTLHQPTMFSWSCFDEARNIDFHGYAVVRAEGVVLVDPMPMSAHDIAHLVALGPVAAVVVTNSDHTRAAREADSRHERAFATVRDVYISNSDSVKRAPRRLQDG